VILVNGTASEYIPALDRGVAYGDGVFRTLLLDKGRPRAWGEHYAKLLGDCAALGITCPHQSSLQTDISNLAREEPNSGIKIIVTRGIGERGYAPVVGANACRIALSFPVPDVYKKYAAEGITARVCELRVGFQPRLAGVKHLNRLENVMARREWTDRSIVEGLLLDGTGNVIGGTMSNVFIVERSVLVTPDLRQCGVAGVTRERVLRHARVRGIDCTITSISLQRLLGADELFVTNSLMGACQVRILGEKSWAAGNMTHTVRRWLDDEDR
jgi:4-amino-4-deoxychorismate lyase